MQFKDASPLLAAGEVEQEETLESMLSRAEGDVSKAYLVKRDGNTVGIVKMKTLVQALVAAKGPEA